MTIRVGEQVYADKAAEFAKDETRVPDINSLDIEHAKKPLMDSLQVRQPACSCAVAQP